MRKLAAWGLVAALCGAPACERSCAGGLGGAGSGFVARGAERVALAMPSLAALGAGDVAALERYLASHPRWEIREEVRGAKRVRYAIRKERVGDAGPWPTTLNGYYSDFSAPNVLQTRVIVGLSGEYGMGQRATTRAAPAAGAVDVALEEESSQPGLSSLLVLTGAVTVEVFEQTRSRRREFTERTLPELDAALAEALSGRPLPAERGPPELRVEEGMQPGIYVVRAKANPGAMGRAFVRVFYVGPDPAAPGTTPPELAGRANLELSAERIRPRSTRVMGYGAAGEVFPYESEVTVYEGDWEHHYLARFELWFEPAGGAPIKLVEATAPISGWQR